MINYLDFVELKLYIITNKFSLKNINVYKLIKNMDFKNFFNIKKKYFNHIHFWNS